jgi:hypothetical protein
VVVDLSLEQDHESPLDNEGVRRPIVPSWTVANNKNRVLGPNQTIQKKNMTATSALLITSRQEQRRPVIHSPSHGKPETETDRLCQVRNDVSRALAWSNISCIISHVSRGELHYDNIIKAFGEGTPSIEGIQTPNSV